MIIKRPKKYKHSVVTAKLLCVVYLCVNRTMLWRLSDALARTRCDCIESAIARNPIYQSCWKSVCIHLQYVRLARIAILPLSPQPKTHPRPSFIEIEEMLVSIRRDKYRVLAFFFICICIIPFFFMMFVASACDDGTHIYAHIGRTGPKICPTCRSR